MKAAALTILIFSLSWASGTLSGHPGGTGGGFVFPETDSVLDTYAYNPEEVMSTIGASYGDYATIDDFNLSDKSSTIIGRYSCWAITLGASPTSLELLYVADDSGVPSGAPISQNSCDIIMTNSGYTFVGYTIWFAEIIVSPGLLVSTPCWLGSHRNDTGTWYPVGGLTVTGSEGYRTLNAGWSWQSFSTSSLEYADLFKIIEDVPISLNRTTWGAIKSSF